jgi:hypothetical protein
MIVAVIVMPGIVTLMILCIVPVFSIVPLYVFTIKCIPVTSGNWNLDVFPVPVVAVPMTLFSLAKIVFFPVNPECDMRTGMSL